MNASNQTSGQPSSKHPGAVAESKVAPDPAASPEELELLAKVERTREDLGETVERLAAKADVKAQARARKAELTARARRRIDQLGHSAPPPVALAAVAAIAAAVSGWLIVTWWRER